MIKKCLIKQVKLGNITTVSYFLHTLMRIHPYLRNRVSQNYFIPILIRIRATCSPLFVSKKKTVKQLGLWINVTLLNFVINFYNTYKRRSWMVNRRGGRGKFQVPSWQIFRTFWKVQNLTLATEQSAWHCTQRYLRRAHSGLLKICTCSQEFGRYNMTVRPQSRNLVF